MRKFVISLAAMLILPACGTTPMVSAPTMPLAQSSQIEAAATKHYYRIDAIRGIGPVYRQKLQAIGIFGTQNLLEKLATRKDRYQVSKQTGISEKLLVSWVNKADLMRIPGIGPAGSDLLEAVDINTVPDLARRTLASIYPKIEFANKVSRKFTGQTPTQAQVQRWIDTAKTMDRVVTY